MVGEGVPAVEGGGVATQEEKRGMFCVFNSGMERDGALHRMKWIFLRR